MCQVFNVVSVLGRCLLSAKRKDRGSQEALLMSSGVQNGWRTQDSKAGMKG